MPALEISGCRNVSRAQPIEAIDPILHLYPAVVLDVMSLASARVEDLLGRSEALLSFVLVLIKDVSWWQSLSVPQAPEVGSEDYCLQLP